MLSNGACTFNSREILQRQIDDFKKCQSLSLLRKSWAFAMDMTIAEDNKGGDINLAAILRNLSSLYYSYLLKVIGGYKGGTKSILRSLQLPVGKAYAAASSLVL